LQSPRHLRIFKLCRSTKLTFDAHVKPTHNPQASAFMTLTIYGHSPAISFPRKPFSLSECRYGLNVELEYSKASPIMRRSYQLH
jgi:hypothetical protein